MNIRLSAPSKTFLCGEYAVLRGGPALVLGTSPRFALKATPGEENVVGLPEGSPAAGWLKARAPLLRDWRLEFLDPHAGRGGFGASGAQFLLVHAFTTFLQSSVARVAQGYDLKALWNDFRVLNGGSGADVLAQSVGGVALVDVARVQAEARRWPFPDLGFAVLRTGVKVPTHEHLRELQPQSLAGLVQVSAACVESFAPGRSEDFVRDSNTYVTELERLHLQAETTLAITRTLRAQSWCRLAKGCGALGADTVLVLFASADRAQALSGVAAWDLVATDAELSNGLGVEWT